MRRRLPNMLLAVSLSLVAAGCATSGPPPGGTVGRSVQQPLRDLNVVREPTAPVLARARLAPYQPPAPPVCDTIATELALLDAALGPDIDVNRETAEESLPGKLASDAIGDLIGLPYRGVVRRLTGAEKREREARADKLAGSIRRGFLKGWAGQAGCSPMPSP